MGELRTALVTGASSGIGEAFCRELAARGHHLVVVARRAAPLDTLAGELRSRHGVQVETIAADLTSPEGLRAVELRLSDPGRPVDLLVNSAGLVGRIGPLPHQEEGAHERLIDLNIAATVRLTRAAVTGMVPRRRGGVVNLSSASAFAPAPGGAAYVASKAFVVSFSQSVHGEVKWLGVSVTALCPGSVATAGSRSKGGRFGRVIAPEAVARQGLAAVAAGRPVHVVGADYRLRAAAARWFPGLVRRGRYQTWGRRAADALAAGDTTPARA
ncbi:SDR family NAD(P)-dependent oxidoreductase [Sphaerisporangium sp. TRM90804]|uniref:SDR family NAD(P)-dependent oxidoreductase n=1 Tax=Sphaerisporangium sp. TRM90804 TaxID=3031113 RepID=UPI0024480FB6|nr:SDR family NAD(P)-dependent oxidoreductase [Sphaerisporangium sp. TRM90804]MDH2427229.1 SDR family NAD(P)-dependent oxidoreductase [Sphaerisporangium sp. TRM90804]